MPELLPLLPGLWSVETHLADFDVRGAVVAGAKRAVIWDTLARPGDMDGVAELVPDLPLTVVYSHGDWDHVWGTAGIGRPWDEVVAHEECGRRFQGGELAAELARMKADFPGLYHQVVLVPPTRTVTGSPPAALDLGGIHLELHSLPGHTADTVVGFIPQRGVLLAGDAVETPLPFLNPGCPVETWAQGLERWAARGDVELVIPAHGRVGGPELLGQNARYLRALAAGEEPALEAEAMTPFYRDTHAANLEVARAAASGEPPS